MCKLYRQLQVIMFNYIFPTRIFRAGQASTSLPVRPGNHKSNHIWVHRRRLLTIEGAKFPIPFAYFKGFLWEVVGEYQYGWLFFFTIFLSFVSQGAIGLRPFYVCLLEWKSLLHKEWTWDCCAQNRGSDLWVKPSQTIVKGFPNIWTLPISCCANTVEYLQGNTLANSESTKWYKICSPTWFVCRI